MLRASKSLIGTTISTRGEVSRQHVRLLSSEPFGWFAPPKFTRAWEPTLLWNHYTQNPSSRMNADDRLSLDPLRPVEGGNRIVEGSHIADVCPQSTIPHPLDDLTQLG